MKITPLEIRQKTFEKNFRGYDKDEVSSFLVSLSQEWEREMDEKRELKIKLEQVQKESAKLREVEDSLFKTLKAAEDTGASMIEQANKTAELILKEAQMNADAMISEAKGKARNIIDEAESRAKRITEDLKADVSALVENYEELMSQREIVLRNLKKLASDSLENVQQSQEDIKRVDVDAYAKTVKELTRQTPPSSSETASRQKERSHTFVIEQKKESPNESGNESNIAQEELNIEESKLEKAAEKQVTASEVSTTPPAEEAPSEGKTTEASEPKPSADDKKKASGSFFDQFD